MKKSIQVLGMLCSSLLTSCAHSYVNPAVLADVQEQSAVPLPVATSQFRTVAPGAVAPASSKEDRRTQQSVAFWGAAP